MVCEVRRPETVRALFGDWEETLITSCLQQVMGKLYADNPENPESVAAVLGDFCYFAGKPNRELAEFVNRDFLIMVAREEAWNTLIAQVYPEAVRKSRYAFRKETKFDVSNLWELLMELPDGYTMQLIDGDIYDQCLRQLWSEDFVAKFESKEDYLTHGLGMAALLDGELVAACSSYSYWNGGIEIEVGTRKDHRRRHLATACAAGLILECLKRGLNPSWDAANLWSVGLAKKLGYEFTYEYPAYELDRT